MMVGGNTEVMLQKKSGSTTNSIGEKIPAYVDYKSLTGWLDLSNGDSKYTHYTKLQESTHIFICDYTPIERNADDKRLLFNGDVYDVLLIDDPMELHEHLEIYLKYLG